MTAMLNAINYNIDNFCRIMISVWTLVYVNVNLMKGVQHGQVTKWIKGHV